VLYFAFPAKLREHEGSSVGRQHKLDILGVVTLIGWVVPLLLGLTWAPEDGIQAPNVVLAFGISAALFIAFIVAEIKHPEPIVPLSLFKNSIISLCCVSGLIIALAMFGCILFLPLYFQAVQESSASKSGYMMLPMMLTITIASVVSGQLIARTGRYKFLALFALGMLGLGTFGLSTLELQTPWMVAVLSMIFVGIGLGFSFPVFTIAGQNAAGERQMGVVTGVIQFARSIGGTLGAAIFNSVLLSYYSDYLEKHLPNETSDEVRALLENPLKLYEGGQAGLAKLTGTSAQMVPMVKQALVVALHNIFFDAAVIIAVGFACDLFLKEMQLRKHPENVSPAPADPEFV
jgi:Na+/melibiose symporter-like transporter